MSEHARWRALLARAVKGWNSDGIEVPQQLAAVLTEKLRAGFEPLESGGDYFAFISAISSIRLRGMNESSWLITAARGSEAERQVRHFWQLVNGPQQLTIAIALTEDAAAALRRIVPKGFVCIIEEHQLVELLASSDAPHVLTQYVREQISARRLIPYVTKYAVSGNMFYGRRAELDQMLDSDSNIAIAGQGRIGKSSLAAEYLSVIKTREGANVHRQWIDCFACPTKSESVIAQFLAVHLDGGSSRSARMSAEGLEPFLRYTARKVGARLEIVLDEVDSVCASHTFRHLAHLSRQLHGPIFRIILIGRGHLLREVLDEASPLKRNVTLLRLEPLDARAARRLIMEPCAELGLRFADDALVDAVLRLTGRLPQLLQHVGYQLSQSAIAAGSTVITEEQIDVVWNQFETAEVLASVFDELQDQLSRLVAAVVIDDELSLVDEYRVIEIAAHYGHKLEIGRARRICDDLLLVNFFAWTRAGYQVANDALRVRLKDSGVIARELAVIGRGGDAAPKTRHSS